MKPTLLYRTASVLYGLFAVGHTLGFLRFKPPTTEAQAALDAMRNVHFPVGGTSFTLGDFYVGFGLYVTVYLLFSAILAWQLGDLTARFPRAFAAIAWTFFVVQLAGLALSSIYFFTAPIVFSAVLAACLGWAAFKVQSSGASS